MANKKLDKLKTAGADMDKFFSGASQSVSEPTKKRRGRPARETTEKPKKEPRNKPEKGQEKPKKKVFSFRADEVSVDSWRVWADAKGIKVDELGEKAINEYINKHALTADQKKIYDLKMAQKKA